LHCRCLLTGGLRFIPIGTVLSIASCYLPD
jgi:hypothetical protein